MLKLRSLARDRRVVGVWRWRSPRAATTTTTAAAAAAAAVAAAAEAARSRCCCRSRRRRATSRRTGRTSRRKVKELCPDCEIIYSNADQDAAKQQQQAEAAITKGAKVLVLDPVDAASAGAIVQRAKQSEIPVISYDRLITDADIDYYISFDNEQVGKLQGESLVEKLDGGRRQGRHRDDQRRARRTTTPSCSRRARTASSTTAASRSPRSTTRRTGARTRPSRRWSRRSPRSARTASWASTPPTTAPPAARSRR